MALKQGKDESGKDEGKEYRQAKDAPETNCIKEIPLSRIVMNPHQPRSEFDEEELNRLSVTIVEHGLLDPILVLPMNADGKYQLVYGERRVRACRMLGWDTIPAYIKEIADIQVAALIENMLRSDLSPFDEAKTLLEIKDKGGYTNEQLGDMVGLSHDQAQKLLSINNIPEEVQAEYAHVRDLPKTLLYEVSKLKSSKEMFKYLQLYREGEKSIVEIRKEISRKNKRNRLKANVVGSESHCDTIAIDNKKCCYKFEKGKVSFESFRDVLTEDDVKEMCLRVLETVE